MTRLWSKFTSLAGHIMAFPGEAAWARLLPTRGRARLRSAPDCDFHGCAGIQCPNVLKHLLWQAVLTATRCEGAHRSLMVRADVIQPVAIAREDWDRPMVELCCLREQASGIWGAQMFGQETTSPKHERSMMLQFKPFAHRRACLSQDKVGKQQSIKQMACIACTL